MHTFSVPVAPQHPSTTELCVTHPLLSGGVVARLLVPGLGSPLAFDCTPKIGGSYRFWPAFADPASLAECLSGWATEEAAALKRCLALALVSTCVVGNLLWHHNAMHCVRGRSDAGRTAETDLG